MMIITSSKIYIINQRPPVGSCCNDEAKYTEDSGKNHLTKNIRKNMEVSKYTQCRILVPHNNVNANITGVNAEKVSPHKL